MRALEQEPRPREIEVLELISDGLVNREVGLFHGRRSSLSKGCDQYRAVEES
jgi:DNA-binding NarL/FixJ family response regulator